MALHPVDAKTGNGRHGLSRRPDEHENAPTPFHAKAVETCLQLLQTSLQGLSEAEATARQKQHGQKGIDNCEARFAPQIFLNSVKKYISLLFIATAGLSFYMGHVGDGLMIIAAMLLNIGIQGLIQWKSLHRQTFTLHTDAIRCQVRRDGQTHMVNASELVSGDILIIESGLLMPADARLISSYQMQVDESSLTGESVLVPKNANEVLHPMEDVTAQANMLFAGTLVKTGKGEAVVTALGSQTIMGRIASVASKTRKRQSPFTRRLNALSLQIFGVALVLTGIVVAVGLYRHMPLPLLLQVALVMGIAAFPETIPSLASLIMSLGINRLNDKKVLVKSFQALETIGDLTVVCTDKTGTLTENYLTFDQLFLPGLGAVAYDPDWQRGENIPCKSVEEFLRIGRLNNGTVLEGLRSAIMGDPIDVALYRAAPASLEAGYHVRLNVPFDPATLRSATICETPDKYMVSMIKGAPESVMEVCKYFMKPDGTIAEISVSQRSEFLMFNRKLAFENNLRIIGFAQKYMAENDDSGPYSDAIFVGWVCLLDPPKPGVIEALDQLRQTGCHLVMITGDQKATAEITARELGIMRRNSDEVWLRSDLEAWDDPKIPDCVKVFARTKPEEKLAIVESLQRSGQIVAMVGDGVNDAPALQKSDVAIAMGLQGTEAAKESADIILINDRLEGIGHAAVESRILRHKIHACIRYLLSCNLGLLLFITAAVVLGQGLPLNALQMLWLNLVIVSIPALVLAIEPPSAQVLAQPSEPETTTTGKHNFKPAPSDAKPQSDPLDANHLVLMAYWGMIVSFAGLAAYFIFTLGLKQSAAMAGTAAFCTLAFAQTFNLFNIQALNAGENRRAFLAEIASTPITWVVVGLALLLQVATLYLPGLNTLLGITAIPLQWAIVPAALGAGAILFSLKTTRIP